MAGDTRVMKIGIGRVATFVALLVALVIILGLYFHIRTLNSEITKLSYQVEAQEEKVVMYQQAYCTAVPSVVSSDTYTNRSVEVEGTVRTYGVHTPNNYDPAKRYPVVLSFDGIDGSGAQMRAYSGLDTLPALVVYPDSLVGKEHFTAWQGAPYSVEGKRDTDFVKKLIETLPSEYCIDETNIFAVGMSNGGAFALIAGCELGDKIKAVASISGAYYGLCKNTKRVPSLIAIHSQDDNRVPFNGEIARGLPNIPVWAHDQARARGCATGPIKAGTATALKHNWYDCKDGAVLSLLIVTNQVHGWLTVPQSTQNAEPTTAQYIWDFFSIVR